MKKKTTSQHNDKKSPQQSGEFGLWTAKESESTGSDKQQRSTPTQFQNSGRFSRAIQVSQLSSQPPPEPDKNTGVATASREGSHPLRPGWREHRSVENAVSVSQVARDPMSLEKENNGRKQTSATVMVTLLAAFSMVGVLGWYLTQQPRPLTMTTAPEQDTESLASDNESSASKAKNSTATIAPQVAGSVGDREAGSQAIAQDDVTSSASTEATPDLIEEKLEKAAISTLARFESAEQEYQEILALAPENPEALAGLAVLRERELRRMNQVINRTLLSDYRQQSDAISQSLGTTQGFLKTQIDDLTEMCLAIDNQIVEAKQQQFSWWIALANRRLRDGILTLPEKGSALYAYRRAQVIDETSPDVVSGLAELRQAIIKDSGKLLDSGKTERALAALEIAQDIRSEASIELLIKQIRLSNKKQIRTPETYVVEAEALMVEGRLLGDDSALAVLNRALVLDPASSAVIAKRHELAAQLVQRAEAEADREDIAAATADLKVALAVHPDNGDARILLQALSERTGASEQVTGSANETQEVLTTATDVVAPERLTCERDYECIGIAVDSDDRAMSKLASEFSAIVTGSAVGTVVKPTSGPVASTVNLLSKSNAGLSVLPSDMLRYTARTDDPVLASAARHLRYVMSLGTQTVYLIANSKINAPADLDGKHVVFGPQDDNLWVVANNLMHAYGVSPGYSYEYDTELAVNRLVNGDVDAVFVISSEQTPFSAAVRLMLDDANQEQQRFKLVGLPIPLKTLEYESNTVSLAGLGERVETVSVKPILVSYNFAQQDSEYFSRRCDEMAQVGTALMSQISELKDVGHPLWSQADWLSQCGEWRRDECFFRNLDSLALAQAQAAK